MLRAGERLYVNFVHGYQDLDYEVDRDELPALWIHEADDERVVSLPFPRNVADFDRYRELIVGAPPAAGTPDFRKLPRFGLTGSHVVGDTLYAGSWNGVYRISLPDARLESIISHPLMNDMHGIWADEERIVTVLTGRDTVVVTDHAGAVIDHFTISRSLDVYRDETLTDVDWRFVTKGFRGACGDWHFNYVQVVDGAYWLTSRNAGAVIVVEPGADRAHLRTMNHRTPVLLHDGWELDGRYHFTSIDGKIIIASEPGESSKLVGAEVNPDNLFRRDLVAETIKLNETEFGREPNWCRGIARSGDVMYVAIDGRYDEDLSFGILAIDEAGKVHGQRRLNWRDVGDESEIRYVTGFDVQVVR